MRKIAVFTSHVYEQMSAMMQKGLIDAARKYGVKLIFFASFGDSYSARNYGEFSRYDEGDCVSFDIPDLDDFDGVIKISTYFSQIIKDHLKKLLSKYDKPIINIGGKDEGQFNVRCDDIATFSKVVEHVVECHGCKDIFHLAGEKTKNFTTERLDAFKTVLESHGIPFEEEKNYYGTLWFDCGNDALDYILKVYENRDRKLPEAVVCDNDYSAVGLINACKERGIRVPEDLIITGFDGVAESVSGFPTITTARQPFYDMGYTAITTILKMTEGEKFSEDIKIVGDILINQSCGCVEKTVDKIEDFRLVYTNRLDNATGIAQSMTNLMISVSENTSFEDCFRAIRDNAKTDTGFKEMLLCLAPGWDKQRIVGAGFSKEDEEMTIVTGYRKDGNVPVQTFRKKDILPKDMLEDPNPYYVFALHHLQYYMGYLIVSPDIDYREQKAVQSWFVNLGVIMETKRIQRDMERSVSRLQFLYNRDMLTELYNRWGLEEHFQTFYNECIALKSGLTLIAIDMDGLKYINDNFGHNEGDYGLKTIAYGLMSASSGDEICARTGGDEFIVLAKNYTKEKALEFIERARTVIAQKVMLDGKEFKVGFSSGIHVEYPDDSSESDAHKVFEHCLKAADESMYSEKRGHKSGRNG